MTKLGTEFSDVNYEGRSKDLVKVSVQIASWAKPLPLLLHDLHIEARFRTDVFLGRTKKTPKALDNKNPTHIPSQTMGDSFLSCLVPLIDTCDSFTKNCHWTKFHKFCCCCHNKEVWKKWYSLFNTYWLLRRLCDR